MISTSNWDWFNTDQSGEPRTTEDNVAEETYERDRGYQYLLNVGPSKDGRMAKVYTDRLTEAGAALGVTPREKSPLAQRAAGVRPQPGIVRRLSASSALH